jgi:hypothetical protein
MVGIMIDIAKKLEKIENINIFFSKNYKGIWFFGASLDAERKVSENIMAGIVAHGETPDIALKNLWQECIESGDIYSGYTDVKGRYRYIPVVDNFVLIGGLENE